ncbi:glycosyltransferase [Rhodobacterales bacterium HKCCA1058]|nr:glycosyltransferase [Rhodobacterales bacterium HKCCA1058]
MTVLEVFVPTYNRPIEFEKCLGSLEKSLLFSDKNDRRLIGIAINDNSTDYFDEYEAVIENFRVRFEELGISYFDYRRTGFDIGGINNIVSGIYAAKADYVWLLPDDDLSRFDAISILISTIRKFQPSFIGGAWRKKSVVQYQSNSLGEDDGIENKVFDVIHDKKQKIPLFLEKNVVQAQEYVYQTQPLKNFLKNKENRYLLNDMFPGLLALVCLWSDGAFVRLERSVGIFRDGDPRSEWRHRWFRLALIEWPQLCEKLFNRGLLSSNEYWLSVGVFRSMLLSVSKRPDILLGLRRGRGVNPFLLFKYHRSVFLKVLLRMPITISIEIVNKLRK